MNYCGGKMAETKKHGKISLIEFLMILMLVGIIFTFIVPMKQKRANFEKMKEAVRIMQVIRNASIEFKNDPDGGDGDYAWVIDQLNMDLKQEGAHYFDYSLTDTTVVATTNKNFGKEGLEIMYYMPTGPFSIKDEKTKAAIDPNWLP
jgi:type II secretory pathway pseudopilin PulG